MFKKLHNKINDIFYKIENLQDRTADILKKCDEFDEIKCSIRRLDDKISKYTETIKSQQRTIEQLESALCDKYEHGLFIFSEDCKIPTVIRNGKILTNDLISSFSIDWEVNSVPDINFTQLGGTSFNINY